MDFREKWEIVDERGIGEGGQGKVFRVIDKTKFNSENIQSKVIRSIRAIAIEHKNAVKKANYANLKNSLIDIIKIEDPTNSYALKILHEPIVARDDKRAQTRIKNEIKAMSDNNHPNLLKIIDFDTDGKWFVSDYHYKGSLNKNTNLFTGNFVSALNAIRPLVEGIAFLHSNGIVHRDIKPENVFINSANELILGDFGLVSFVDEKHTRISDTWDNVGTRDWMPGWAMGILIEELNYTFDIFSLGKLLWSMISDTPKLQLWYYTKDKFNLEKKFPNTPYIKFANEIFSKCIVEEEKDCLKNAQELLSEIDQVLSIIAKNADIINHGDDRPCKICGIGNYKLKANKDRDEVANFGIIPAIGNNTFKIFVCNHCGNVQLFFFGDNFNPKAWSE